VDSLENLNTKRKNQEFNYSRDILSAKLKELKFLGKGKILALLSTSI
jgi:hypothetical protein